MLEDGFKRLESAYARALDVGPAPQGPHRCSWPLVIVVASLALVPMIGAEFAPAEDMSMFMIAVEAPVGISLEAMDRKMQEIERIVLSQPEVRSGFAAIDLEERGRVNSGIMFCRMLKPDQREAAQTEVVQRLRRELAAGRRRRRPRVVEFSFYNVAGEGARVGPGLLHPRPRARRARPCRPSDRRAPRPSRGFVDVDTNLDLEQPQLFVTVDRERAHDLGLDAATIFETVYALVAGREVGSYTTEGKRYDVRIKVHPSQAQTPEDIGALQVRTPSGEMVRLDTVVDITHGVGPININRTDRERSHAAHRQPRGPAAQPRPGDRATRSSPRSCPRATTPRPPARPRSSPSR